MNKVIIYLDLILIFDFLINYIFLIFIEKIYNEKIKYFKIFLVSLLGSILIIFAFYNHFYLNLSKILGGILLLFLVSKSDEKSKIIIKISLFYTLNLSLVGVLSSFKITKWYILLCGIIVILVLFIFENYRKYHIFIRDNEYNVLLEDNKKTIVIKGLLDTGNISSYMGYPIVYINKKYNYLIKQHKKVILEVESVNSIRNLEGYIFKDFLFEIRNKKYCKDVILVFVDISVDCLLNPMLML